MLKSEESFVWNAMYIYTGGNHVRGGGYHGIFDFVKSDN